MKNNFFEPLIVEQEECKNIKLLVHDARQNLINIACELAAKKEKQKVY